MSQIYIHFTDKTLVLGSSENLLYPLLGSLLRWDTLRVAFALSLTQSTTDNNAGFANVETLPIVGGNPTLNRVSIGLKNKGLELPGETNCTFVGYSNDPSTSNGSSLGFASSVIQLSTKDVITFPMNVQATGISGYAITSSPTTLNLTAPFDNLGTFYTLPTDNPVIFNGKATKLASPLGNGQTQVHLYASPSVTLFNADLAGTAKSTQIGAAASLGCSNGTSAQFTTTTNTSQCLSFPASFVMQGSSNYATIMLMEFKCTNRGTPSQTVQVGYQFIPNIGDTSITHLESLMSSYVPAFTSSAFNYNVTMPTSLFVRWPFPQTRLRIHSIAAKKF